MKPCAIWPAVSLCQTQHRLSPPRGLVICANISMPLFFFRTSSLLAMLTVVDLVCMPERRRYTLGINLIAAFSSNVTYKVNVYLVLRLL